MLSSLSHVSFVGLLYVLLNVLLYKNIAVLLNEKLLEVRNGSDQNPDQLSDQKI